MNILEKYSHYVNESWHKYLILNARYKNKHMFLKDMELVETYELKDNNAHFVNKNIKNINFNPIDYFDIAKCKYVPKKILSKEVVDDIFRQFMNRTEPIFWDKLSKQLDDLSDHLLYSNVKMKTIENVFQNKAPDCVNVLILGAGPTGLYIANYLNSILTMSPNINLLVVDNKITKETYRMPYTRNRIFGVDLYLFSSFFPNIASIQNLTTGMRIKYLEYILLILLYGYDIPIYFTNKISTQASLEKFVHKNNVDIVYDCTGGRLKNNFIRSTVDTANFFPRDILLSSEKFMVVPKINEFRLEWKNNIDRRFFLSVETYDCNNKFIAIPFVSNELLYTHDVKLFHKLHNKCLRVKQNKILDLMKIFDNMKDLNLSKSMESLLLDNLNNNMKFYIIEAEFYHKNIISSVIKIKNKQTLYIGAGDTILSSHFIVGAGLNRMLGFIQSIVWYVQTLSNFNLQEKM